MLTAETKRRIDACRDVLVRKLPLPTDQVELITLALIYKFMDDLDEDSVKLGGKRSFFTGPLAKYRWRNLLPQTVSADERMVYSQKESKRLEKQNTCRCFSAISSATHS